MKNLKKCVVDINEAILDAIRLFSFFSSDTLYVLDKDVLLGHVSKDDVLNFLCEGGSIDSPIRDLSIRACNNVLSVVDVDKAENILKEEHLDSIPVIDNGHHLHDIIFYQKDKYEIRELSRKDIPAVSAFFDNLGGEGQAFFNQNDKNRIRAFRYLTDNSKDEIHFGVFINPNNLIGYFALLELNTSIPWVGLALLPEYKGFHLGRMILSYSEQYAKKHGYGGLMLSTSAANIRGQNLYMKMGFSNYGMRVSREYLFIKRFQHKED